MNAAAQSMRTRRSDALLPPPRPRLLQRKCGCGGHTPAGGTCGSCAASEQRGGLAIGASNDALEREADHVANTVLAAPAAGPARATVSPTRIQRATASSRGTEAAAPPSVTTALAGHGRPLEAATRSTMEGRFGQDFSQVRVHTDGASARSANDIGARAYTAGQSIVFGAGEYAPSTPAGQHLLAHELTHTLQQRGDMVVQRAPKHGLGGEGPSMHGGTLPHTEATELNKCMEIMNDSEYCRAEVLGEKTPPHCAKTYTIPDSVHAAIGVAWGKSKHGEKKVQEHGGRIVTDKTGTEQIRTGAGGSGSISLPAAKRGDKTIGTFHTHPYNNSKGAPLGVAFSGEDIENFVAGDQGGVKYVGAGSCYFVLDTLSYVERDTCKKAHLNKRWKKSFKAATGTFQGRVETAVKDTIAGCGICFYKVCRPDAASPVPKIATQV